MLRHYLALQRVKELIETLGWVQHAYTLPEGICLSEAVTLVKNDPTHKVSFGTLSLLILHQVDMHDMGNYPSLISFNDAEGRTKEQILHVLDLAIAAES